MWEAAQLGNLDRLRSILDKGTNANVRDESGYTPLHYACRAGKIATVTFLLKNGVRGLIGRAVLHSARRM